MPLSRLALNLITAGTSHSFESLLNACVDHGIQTVSPWQEHYALIGATQAASLLRKRSITVNTVCRMTGFGPAVSATSWQQAIDDAHRLIDEAATLGARSITVVGGGSGPSGDLAGARDRIVQGVAQVLPAARAAGVVLALEPLHPMVAAERGAINTLEQAVRYAGQLGEGVGVMVDAYNSWWDPALAKSIAAAGGRIAGLQISDWLIPTNDLAFDRGLPGEGVIDLPAVRGLVERAGYSGDIEIEVLSANWSGRALDELLPAVVASFTRHC